MPCSQCQSTQSQGQIPLDRDSSPVVSKAPVTMPGGTITGGVWQDSQTIKSPVCNTWASGRHEAPAPELKHTLRSGKLWIWNLLRSGVQSLLPGYLPCSSWTGKNLSGVLRFNVCFVEVWSCLEPLLHLRCPSWAWPNVVFGSNWLCFGLTGSQLENNPVNHASVPPMSDFPLESGLWTFQLTLKQVRIRMDVVYVRKEGNRRYRHYGLCSKGSCLISLVFGPHCGEVWHSSVH